MPHDRFFIDAHYVRGEKIAIQGNEFHHLTRVMRLKEGERVECFNGHGALANATVLTIGKQGGELLVNDIKLETKPKAPLSLIQAIPRANRLDIILEKGTELGMNAICLFPGEKSEKTEISPTLLNRCKNLLIAACKQSGQLWLPEIKLLPPIHQWDPFHLPTFFGDPDPVAPLFSEQWFKAPPQKGAFFIVGPEKGFSIKEKEHLKEIGAIGVRLHPLILRTDTAPLAALALMSHWQQDYLK